MLDDRDRKILNLLQENASLAVSDLADRVSLSISACSRRIQRLEDDGYIAKRVVLLDRTRRPADNDVRDRARGSSFG